MGYMKSVDIVLDAYKLSEPQKNAVVDLLSDGHAVKTVTAKALERKGLVQWTENGVWELTESFRAELKAAYSQPEPREEEILPGESIEVTGSYAGGHSQEEILELLGESDGDFTPENIARAIEEIDSESDEAPIPFELTRRMKRQMRRNIARMGRATMRNHGKRIRKYGVLLDPKYVARKLAA